MNRLIRTVILSLGVGATALSSVSPALADDWRRHRHGPPPFEHRHHRGEAAALGVIGLATGLIVGSAIAESRQNDAPVYEPYPVDPYRHAPPPPPDYAGEDPYYYPAAPGHAVVQNRSAGALEPWSPDWHDYCASRYRSFDPSSGTYLGYDGSRHFCTAG